MAFQPTMLGHTVFFGEQAIEGSGMITDEDEDSIYIEGDFFTGWMLKATYFELLGVEE